MTKKDISESLSAYGRVFAGDKIGRQFILPYKWQNDKYCFKFLIFAYGQKKQVVNKLSEMLKTCTDEQIAELTEIVVKDRKVPLSQKGCVGLNCF